MGRLGGVDARHNQARVAEIERGEIPNPIRLEAVGTIGLVSISSHFAPGTECDSFCQSRDLQAGRGDPLVTGFRGPLRAESGCWLTVASADTD